MLEFTLASEPEICQELARRLRQQRVAQGVSLEALATRSGVGRATLQRLEKSGHCSIENWIRTVQALGLAQELQDLFSLKVRSIADMEQQAEQSKRIRAPRRAPD